jgi:hypothetical protein
MQYREIVAVTGLGGLFQLMATKSDGAIVRSLADNTTRFIPSRLHNVTPLESIEIYTTGNNVRLHEVLQKMKDSDTQRPDTKKGSANDIRDYFKSVFPEMDEDRVYASDMKKMLKWYEILQAANLLDFSSMNQTEANGTESGAPEDAASMPAEGAVQLEEHDRPADSGVALVEEGEAQPAKKARAKKATASEEGGEEEKPAKKTAAKKKAESSDEDEDMPKKAAKAKKKAEE